VTIEGNECEMEGGGDGLGHWGYETWTWAYMQVVGMDMHGGI
jgi:hypothetical protein